MRWRLSLIVIGLMLVILAAQDVPLIRYLRRVETERAVASLERDAFILGGLAEDLLSGRNPSPGDLRSSLALYTGRNGANVVVTDQSGRAVVVTEDPAREGTNFATPARPEIDQALRGAPASGRRFSNDLDYELLYVAVPVLDGPQVIGTVRITFPASEIDRRARDRTLGLAAVGLVSLLAGTIAALVTAGYVTRPLRRLEARTKQVAAGDFTPITDADDGPPEVRHLARSFNTMTGRVAGLLDEQRAFASDASHQLRTPLTALRLQLEAAAGSAIVDPERTRTRIEAATAETERLQHLIEGLLVLARAERGDSPRSLVDVTALTAERVAVWSSLAEEKQVTMTAALPGNPCVVRAIPGTIEQVIDNYLDNAVNVTSAGSRIHVTVVAGADAVEIHVADDGPGMTDEQITRAFDRFWRSPDAPHRGSGLGLAIVARLASANGGRASLARRSPTGLDASVRFPAHHPVEWAEATAARSAP